MNEYLVYFGSVLNIKNAVRVNHSGDRMIVTFPASLVKEELFPHAIEELAALGIPLGEMETVDLYPVCKQWTHSLWGFVGADGKPL